MSVSYQLRAAVRESDVTINSLAEVAGISQSVLQRFFSESTDLSLTNVDLLTKALNLKLVRFEEGVICPFCQGVSTSQQACPHAIFVSRWHDEGRHDGGVDEDRWLCEELREIELGDDFSEELYCGGLDELPEGACYVESEHPIWYEHTRGLFSAPVGVNPVFFNKLSNRKRLAHDENMAVHRGRIVQWIAEHGA